MKHQLGRIFILSGFAFMGIAASIFAYSVGNHIVQAMSDQNQNPVYLTLVPQKPVLNPGEETGITVYLHPNNHQVTAVELHLALNTQHLAFVSDSPLSTSSSQLSWVLPNCSAGSTPHPEASCPPQPFITDESALVYLAVPCNEAGCTLPPSNTPFEIATFYVRATANTGVVTTITSEVNGTATLIAAIDSDYDVAGLRSPTSLTITPCKLDLDVIPNGIIDVADIMNVAGNWNSTPGMSSYNGQADLNRNHQIDVADIQMIAASWSQSCL